MAREQDRSGWSRDKIGGYVEEVRNSGREGRFCEVLNAALERMSSDPAAPSNGKVFVRWLNEATEGRQSKDYLIIYERNGEEHVLGAIEYEVGATQSQWKTSLEDVRSIWPLGLNVLYRKDHNKDFDIFVKSNVELVSFFAFASTFLQSGIESGRIPKKTLKKHSLRMSTCDEVYSIPWLMPTSEEYVKDDMNALCRLVFLVAKRKWEENHGTH